MKLNPEIESWNWIIKFKLEMETWNLKLKLEFETWNQKFKLKLEIETWILGAYSFRLSTLVLEVKPYLSAQFWAPFSFFEP